MIGLGFAATSNLYWFGVVIAPLSHAFGWSTADISGWAVVVATVQYLFAPITGAWIDRLGARSVALVSMLVGAGVFCLVGAVMNSLWILYVGAVIYGLGASVIFTPYTRTINGWFVAGRGLALSVAFSGVAITASVVPRIAQAVVDSLGWRAGFYFMGAISLVPLVPVLFWLRERREAPDILPIPEVGYPTSEALRIAPFWLLGVGWCSYYLLYAGVQFSLIPILTDSGLSRAAAASSIGIVAIFILIGKLLAGVIFDRLRAPFLLAGLLLVEIAGLVTLALFPKDHAVAALAIIGLVHGAMIAGNPYCVAQYFGLRCFGGISGMLSVLASVSAAGSLIFSRLRDISGSYASSLLASTLLAFLAAAIITLLGFQPYYSEGKRRRR